MNWGSNCNNHNRIEEIIERYQGNGDQKSTLKVFDEALTKNRVYAKLKKVRIIFKKKQWNTLMADGKWRVKEMVEMCSFSRILQKY